MKPTCTILYTILDYNLCTALHQLLNFAPSQVSALPYADFFFTVRKFTDQREPKTQLIGAQHMRSGKDLELVHLSKRYGDTTAVDNINHVFLNGSFPFNENLKVYSAAKAVVERAPTRVAVTKDWVNLLILSSRYLLLFRV